MTITTPGALPEAIAGRPYSVALAATGGRGALHWTIEGALPEGLSFDGSSGVLTGTPLKGTSRPLSLGVRVSDGKQIDSRSAELLVYQSDRPLTTPVWWKPGIPPLPLRAWLDMGIGFLVLWLVHLVGMNTLASLERNWKADELSVEEAGSPSRAGLGRFMAYRILVRLGTLCAMLALGVWHWIAT